jgi:hypothetical protein
MIKIYLLLVIIHKLNYRFQHKERPIQVLDTLKKFLKILGQIYIIFHNFKILFIIFCIIFIKKFFSNSSNIILN